MTVQDLYNDTKCLDRAYNEDAPYTMASIHQNSQPHEKILWKPEASTLTLNLEEKLLCLQLS
ncbi:MAG: hypothetical protein ACQ9IQ_04490 [Nitrospirales bacterium]